MNDTTDMSKDNPPVPGSVWCFSCDSWFNIVTNTCGCSNR